MNLSRGATIFVVGAHLPNGGALMAWKAAQVVAEATNCVRVAVEVPGPHTGWGMFDEKAPETITVHEMLARATPNDILFCNPSFSHYGLGLNFPGASICYVQGFNTFDFLDCYFDHYVSASPITQEMLSRIYGIHCRIIAPFIDIPPTHTLLRWESRPQRTVLLIRKGDTSLHNDVFERITRAIQNAIPDIHWDLLVNGTLRHREILERIEQSRYMLYLSLADGFGLLPLEAMARRTLVLGLNGYGARSYLQAPKRSLATEPTRIDEAVEWAIHALSVSNPPDSILDEAQRTAQHFCWDRFKSDWQRWMNETF